MSKKYEQQFAPMKLGTPAEEIKRLRLNVIIHSCLYYELNENIWDDITFDLKCKRLVELLREHPDAYSDRFDDFFKDWDGSSGYHFPHRDPWVYGKALMLLKLQQNQ